MEGGGGRSRTLRRSVRDTAVAAIGVYGQPVWVQSSDGGTPPCHRAPDNLDLQPDPRNETDDVEAGDDKMTSRVAGGRYEGGLRRSSRPTRPKGACEMRREVFPSGFPHHVEDFNPSHHFARIPTACGAASAAAALPRIMTAGGGGAVVRDSTVLTAGIRVRVRKALRTG